MRLLFCLVGLVLSFEAFAENYVMPSTSPMSQGDLLGVLNVLTKFFPVGKTSYQGVTPSDGAKCNVTFYLDNTLPYGGFQFPGLNLGFFLGSGGDNVNYVLIKESISNPADGTQALDLAIVNEGGFGDSRLVAYSIKSLNGIPLSYQTAAAISQSGFHPGETIRPVLDVLICNSLEPK